LTCYQDLGDELINAVTPFCAENFIEMSEPENKLPCFISFYLEPINRDEKIRDIERRLREFVTTSLDGWTIRD
jgi:hypothetical protein